MFNNINCWMIVLPVLLGSNERRYFFSEIGILVGANGIRSMGF